MYNIFNLERIGNESWGVFFLSYECEVVFNRRVGFLFVDYGIVLFNLCKYELSFSFSKLIVEGCLCLY